MAQYIGSRNVYLLLYSVCSNTETWEHLRFCQLPKQYCSYPIPYQTLYHTHIIITMMSSIIAMC